MTHDSGPAPEREPAHEIEALLVQAQSALGADDFEKSISLCRTMLDRDPGAITAWNFLAVAQHRAGKTEDGIATLQTALATCGRNAQLLANLGELSRLAGHPQAAVDALQEAAAFDQDNCVIHINLGKAHQDNGDAKAAAAIFRRALELDHTFLAAHQGLRGALGRQEENGGAGIDSSYPVEGACGYFADLLHRGTLASVSDDDLRRAIAPVAQAMREKEQSQGPLLVLGKLLLDCELTQMAKEILEAALRPEGNHPDLYIALSVCYAKLEAAVDAINITGRLVSEYPMMSRTSPSAQAQVLVLEALYSPYVDTPHYGVKVYSHTNTIGAMPAERVSLHHLCINGLDEDYSTLKGDYDVIFNNVGNAELNKIYQYGQKLGGIIDFLDLPTINHPEPIDRTTRDENYRRLKNVENIVFPNTVYFENVEKSTDTMIETVNRDFDFPVLFRTPGHHRSSGLYMADTVHELREAIENMSSDAVYVIQFHESRHSSGNYLMYRTVFIDGVFYPGRMYLSDTWLVSGPAQRRLRRTLIAENSGFQADERGWIDDPEKVLGAANMEALKNLNDVIGLDCFGADVGLLDDGRLVVFEANACMNTLANRRHVEEFPYLKPGADEIQAAIERMILDKAAG